MCHKSPGFPDAGKVGLTPILILGLVFKTILSAAKVILPPVLDNVGPLNSFALTKLPVILPLVDVILPLVNVIFPLVEVRAVAKDILSTVISLNVLAVTVLVALTTPKLIFSFNTIGLPGVP